MNLDRFALELTDPLETAHGRIDRREGFLVSLSHRGTRGVGEATPLPGWTESLTECRRTLERVAERAGREPALGEDQFGGPPGEQRLPDGLDPAVTPAACHGFESAALDARGRCRGRPAYQLLAPLHSSGERDPAERVERVPVNATLGDADVDALLAAAETAVEGGFECLKCKVGAGPVERDLERLSRLRSAVGEGITLRADANAAWDVATAERAIDRLSALEVSVLEQPLSADALAGHADLRGRGVRIGLDEGAIHHSPETIAAAGAADVLVCKPMALGGPVRASALARRARANDLVPVVSTTVDGAFGRAAAVHVAAAIPDVEPCGLATAGRLASDLAPDPAPIDGGTAAVPQRPGLGVDRDGVDRV